MKPLLEEICGDGIDNDRDEAIDENCPTLTTLEVCKDPDSTEGTYQLTPRGRFL